MDLLNTFGAYSLPGLFIGLTEEAIWMKIGKRLHLFRNLKVFF
ncbi:hypothetical protein [Scopulibacillus darangshiensis]|nr:hypothetical protein [Scopulibacillus darangshiensis]